MLIKKLNSNPDFCYIPFPNKTNEVFLEINLKIGYAQEGDKEYGLGHLLEHYLLGSLLKSEKGKELEVNAAISNDKSNFYLKSAKNKIFKESKVFLSSILNPSFSDKILFKNEKNAIFNELKTRISSSKNRGEQLVYKKRFDQNCPYGKDSLDQLKNLKNKKIGDIALYYKKYFVVNNIIFTISGHKLSNKTLKEIKTLIKNNELSQEIIKNKEIKCKYSNFKIEKIKEKSIKEDILLAITFPGLNIKSKSEEKYAISMIGKLLSGTKYGLADKIREVGIYGLSYDKIIWKNVGVLSFFTAIPNNALMPLLSVFSDSIKKLKKELISQKKLVEMTLELKSGLKKEFNNNIERLEWLTYDLINYSKPISLNDDYKNVKKITPKLIMGVAKKILRLDKMNIILIAKKPEKINIKKIKNIFK